MQIDNFLVDDLVDSTSFYVPSILSQRRNQQDVTSQTSENDDTISKKSGIFNIVTLSSILFLFDKYYEMRICPIFKDIIIILI